MVTVDSKTSPEPSVLDSPPSYAVATTLPEASSSAPTGSAPRQPPAELLHLFVNPPNAEPISGRFSTPDTILDNITTWTKGNLLHSMDPRLQDPGVLFDWLRRKALRPNWFKVQCIGAHYETSDRTEWVSDSNGTRERKKGEAERIVDFDFTIDLTPFISHPENHANVHLTTITADVPAFRGSMTPTYSASYAPAPTTDGYASVPNATDGGRPADRQDLAVRAEWIKWRTEHGIPPWKPMRDVPEFWNSRGKGKNTGPITHHGTMDLERGINEETEVANLREWCEAYASDPSLLKGFFVPIWYWGWNFAALKTAVEGAIRSTGYNSNEVQVNILANEKTICILPSNLLSRAVHTEWSYILMCITLIYPIIWMIQRFTKMLGGPYTVSRLSYGLKFYPPLPSTFPNETLEAAQDRLGGMYKMHRELPKPAQLAYGPQGVHYLLGRKEGEWFREWEERIRMGVRMRYKGELQGGGEEEAGTGLDGY